MKFHSLTINNFLTIGHAQLRLDDRGLVLVQGENKDDSSANSNGAGKSTIPDALCWALFGVTARGETGDAVINNKAKKDCAVRVIVKDGEDEYLIARHRKDKTMKNALTVIKGESDLSKGTDKETQKIVEQIVGCSYEVFRAAVYMGQEQMPDIPGMTDKNLKLLVEQAAGIELLEIAYRIARDRLTDARRDHERAQESLERRKNSRDTIAEIIEKTKLRRTENELERIERIKTEKLKAKELIAKRDEMKAELTEGEKEKVTAEVAKIDDKLAALESERAEQLRLQGELTNANAKEMSLLAELKRTAAEVRNAKEAVTKIADRVGSPCGECGKPYEEHDLADAEKIAKESLGKKAQVLRDTKEAHEKALRASQSASEALKAYESSMTDPSALTRSQSDLQRRLAAIGLVERSIEGSTERARDHLLRAKRIEAESNPHDKDLVEYGTRLKDKERDVVEAKEGIKMAAAALAKIEDAAKVYGPAGVRAHILDTVTPFLNDRTAQYLGTLSDGNIAATWATLSRTAKGELREKFKIDVTNDKGAKSFKGLSGGEKRKVRLACALALQDLVASRATKPIDLWIGDEVDDALDTAGLERLMGVLDAKARERGTVLVISHADLKDWIRDTVIVTKEGDASTVSGVLCEPAEEMRHAA